MKVITPHGTGKAVGLCNIRAESHYRVKFPNGTDRLIPVQQLTILEEIKTSNLYGYMRAYSFEIARQRTRAFTLLSPTGKAIAEMVYPENFCKGRVKVACPLSWGDFTQPSERASVPSMIRRKLQTYDAVPVTYCTKLAFYLVATRAMSRAVQQVEVAA